MAAKVIKKRAKRKSGLSGPRYWMAVGTLAAYSATGGSKNAVAQNRTAPTDKVQGNQVQALPVRRYDIAPGPLSVVLQSFESVSGIKISATDNSLFTIQSPGVSGVYTTEQALKAPLDYTISGAPDSLLHTLLEKRDGTYWLALWLGVRAFDPHAYQMLTVPTVPITVTWQGNTLGYRVFTFDGSGNLTNSGHVDGNSAQLNVGANVVILKIAMALNVAAQ